VTVVRRMRVLGLLVALLATVFSLSACNPVLEQDALARLNQLRVQQGLAPLVRDAQLDRKANAQAVRMARQQALSHSDLKIGVPSGWKTLGENVGMGSDVATVQQALVNSPGHYANMVNGAYTRIGIGTVVRNGRLYLVQEFLG
jgi:uncharacterized protein YkwD